MRSTRGFTLVELLVVLVILGALVALATLAGGGDARRAARQEAERIAMLVPLLSDEAVAGNTELGLHFDERGYRVLRHDGASDRWLQLPSTPPHRLPASVALRLEVGGAAVALPEAGDVQASGDVQATAPTAPQLLILSSGDWTPFELRLAARDGGAGTAWRVHSDGYVHPVAMAEAG